MLVPSLILLYHCRSCFAAHCCLVVEAGTKDTKDAIFEFSTMPITVHYFSRRDGDELDHSLADFLTF
jgi:hypothetical protein